MALPPARRLPLSAVRSLCRNGGTLAGEFGHNGFALIRFPDVETAKAWYESADYQALVELRNQAADMTLVLGEPLG